MTVVCFASAPVALAVGTTLGSMMTVVKVVKLIDSAFNLGIADKLSLGSIKYYAKKLYKRTPWSHVKLNPDWTTLPSSYIEEKIIDINFHASGFFGAATNFSSNNKAMDVFLNNGLIQPGCYDDTDDISQCMKSK